MGRNIFRPEDNIDEEECLHMYDDSYEFYVAVLEMFSQEGLMCIDSLNKFFGQKNSEEYWIIIHGLKSSTASVGGMDANRLAVEMDALYKSGDISAMWNKHNEMINSLQRLVNIIKLRLTDQDS